MERIAHIIGLLLALVCSGCATDQQAPQALALAPGQSQIIITRSSSLMYAAAPASVELNGARIASLGVGQSYTGAVSAGPAVITVSAWSALGQSSYRLIVEPGKSYRLVISPRTENTVSGMFGGAIGQAVEGGGPFSVAQE